MDFFFFKLNWLKLVEEEQSFNFIYNYNLPCLNYSTNMNEQQEQPEAKKVVPTTTKKVEENAENAWE